MYIFQKTLFYTIFIASLFAYSGATAQSSLMIHGTVSVEEGTLDGAWLKVLNSETYKTVYHNPIEKSGSYLLKLPYGENYTISFSKPGYTTVEFEAQLVLPEDAQQCCYRPMEISFHFFEPDSMYAHLFRGTFHTIAYKQSLKGFNYDIDVDYMVQQRIVNYELFEKKKLMTKEGKAIREEEILTEKKYIALINQATKFYNSEHYYASRQLFNKASKLRPNRKYPQYKIEDIRTELERFENKAQILGVNVDSIVEQEFALLEPEQTEDTYPTYVPLTEEQVDSIFKQEIRKQIDLMAQSPEEKQELQSAMNDFYNETYVDEDVIQVPVDTETPIAEPEPEERAVDFTSPEIPVEETIEPEPEMPVEVVEDPLEETVIDTIQENQDKPEVSQQVIPQDPPDYPEVVDYKTYQDSLRKRYPEERTVEYSETPNKKITRVILNNGEVVEVYTRVEHSWGATYYFMEEYPTGYQSIGYSAFMNRTRLYEIEGEDR
ncbi:MAG: hypothetical protein PF481_02115 [Bacteroidales bacterium]|jgi:hypothetical protein|nr:hypothetical protein [Bacteroidales bacterium]